MSIVPNEILEDILQLHDRWTLDELLYMNRRYLLLITQHLRDVCVRNIKAASITMRREPNTTGSSYSIRLTGAPHRVRAENFSAFGKGGMAYNICGNAHAQQLLTVKHDDEEQLFVSLMHSLRNASVRYLCFDGVHFTPSFLANLEQSQLVTGRFALRGCGFAGISDNGFYGLVAHFKPRLLTIHQCSLRGSQVSDDFIRMLFRCRVQRTCFSATSPIDGVNFAVTDEGVLDFCAQHDMPLCEGEDPRDRNFYAGLVLSGGGRCSKELFKRLVDVYTQSSHTDPIRVVLSPSPVKPEDLQDYASCLTLRNQGHPINQMWLYDFYGLPHGAPQSRSRLQIALNAFADLEVLFGPSAGTQFYETAE